LTIPAAGDRLRSAGPFAHDTYDPLTRDGKKANMRIGDQLSRDTALACLRSYAENYPQTIRFYDLAGDPDGRPGPGGGGDPVNKVTLADIGRLVAIGAKLAPEDVAKLLNVDASREFEAVPATAELEHCSPGSELHAAATALYDSYRFEAGSNIGRAKRSKLLHMKRPMLVPIFDTRVAAIYRSRVQRRPKTLSRNDASWEAVREDLCDGAEDFGWLVGRLSADSDPGVRRLGRLTNLRLLDILAWTAAGT
jgi:hypothetical protein